MAHTWTAQEIERAVKLRASGVAANVIAAELGPGFTRSAVLGKMFRIKAPRSSAGRPRIKRKSIRAAVESAAVAVTQAIVLTFTHKLKLTQLGEHSCRWPMWKHDAEPFTEKLYCGAYAPGRAENKPYCKAHTKKSMRQW